MKITTVLLGALATVSLVSCGSDVDDSSAPATSNPTAKAPKFKGQKFAPPQDVMNRAAAAEFWSREGSRKVTPFEACYGSFRLSQMEEQCKPHYENVLNTSVFTPRECRKGDERKGYDSVLVNPVTCDGDIDTPNVTAKVMMVFHETDGTTKAWYGGMVAGTMVKR